MKTLLLLLSILLLVAALVLHIKGNLQDAILMLWIYVMASGIESKVE